MENTPNPCSDGKVSSSDEIDKSDDVEKFRGEIVRMDEALVTAETVDVAAAEEAEAEEVVASFVETERAAAEEVTASFVETERAVAEAEGVTASFVEMERAVAEAEGVTASVVEMEAVEEDVARASFVERKRAAAASEVTFIDTVKAVGGSVRPSEELVDSKNELVDSKLGNKESSILEGSRLGVRTEEEDLSKFVKIEEEAGDDRTELADKSFIAEDSSVEVKLESESCLVTEKDENAMGDEVAPDKETNAEDVRTELVGLGESTVAANSAVEVRTETLLGFDTGKDEKVLADEVVLDRAMEKDVGGVEIELSDPKHGDELLVADSYRSEELNVGEENAIADVVEGDTTKLNIPKLVDGSLMIHTAEKMGVREEEVKQSGEVDEKSEALIESEDIKRSSGVDESMRGVEKERDDVKGMDEVTGEAGDEEGYKDNKVSEGVDEAMEELGKEEVFKDTGESQGVGEAKEEVGMEEVIGDAGKEGSKDNNGSVVVDEAVEDVGGFVSKQGDDLEAVCVFASPVDGEGDDEAFLSADKELEIETETPELGKNSGGGKRKRGKGSKAVIKSPSESVTGEDVCFICFDGGDLVICDRRNCQKAYHPACVNHDEEFFKAKGRWTCGWHLCSTCQKNAAEYLCYTCTYSLCKSCIKNSVILCIRGKKGFCQACMKMVMLIENGVQRSDEEHVDFDDKGNWEYLFKDYYVDLKAKHSISLDELRQAKSPGKGIKLSGKQASTVAQFGKDDVGSDSDHPSENLELQKNKRSQNSEARKNRRRNAKTILKDDEASDSDYNSTGNLESRKKRRRKAKSDSKDDESSGPDNLPDIVEARKNKKEKLSKRLKRSPNEEGSSTAAAGGGANKIAVPVNNEWASKELLEFVMHMKNGDKSVVSQFDVQAMLLEYIKTNKLRDPRRKSQIVCDERLKNLFGRVRVGHFEMLKLLESHFRNRDDSQVDDVQGSVVDTEVSQLDDDDETEVGTKAGKARKRKFRKKADARGRQFNRDEYAAVDNHNINLIYLRRKLVEDLLEDLESFNEKVVGTFVRIRILGNNQKPDIYRLVQVLGTAKAAEPYKVGKRKTDILLEILNLSKTELISMDTISNQEFTEDECKRLRQSMKCGLLNSLTVGDILDKSMEIQAARVNDWLESEVVRLNHLCDRASDMGHRKQLRECVEKLQLLKTPEERNRRLEELPSIHVDPHMDPNYESQDETDSDDKKQEVNMRPRGSNFSRKGRDPISPGGESSSTTNKDREFSRSLSNKNLLNIEETKNSYDSINESSWMQDVDNVIPQSNSSEIPRMGSEREPSREIYSAPVADEAVAKVNESEKIWQYKDPQGKVQGPFSMAQLRKWSKNGYFPTDLKIWGLAETEDTGILLTDALLGKFPFLGQKMDVQRSNLTSAGNQSSLGWMTPSEIAKPSIGPNGPYNLPSPTPKQDPAARSGGEVGPSKGASPGGNGALPSPTPNSVQGAHPMELSNNLPLPPGTSLPTGNTSQPVLVQNPATGPQDWGSAPAPNVQQIVPGQTQPYYQWGGIQNPAGNFQPNPEMGWVGTAPVQVNQPNLQHSLLAPNVTWGTMPSNPNVGWVGPAQINPGMNWGSSVQGPLLPGNVNPGWVMPNGQLGGGIQVQGQVSMSMNPGWVSAPTSNLGTPVQGTPPNQGWVAAQSQGWTPPTGNSGAPVQVPSHGNSSSGWGSQPGGNQASGLTNDQQQHRRDHNSRTSEGSSRSRNRQSSFGRDGTPKSLTPCPYFPKGTCKMGSFCGFLHS